MKKTQVSPIYPFGKGLDKTSIPGAQDKRSLNKANNIILNNRGSLRKRPGARRIDYIGDDSGNLQAAIQFFATSGAGQKSEVIRVIGGRIEAIRDGQAVDLGIQVSDTDTITFERFGNALIIHFENTRPKYYTIGGTLNDLEVLSGHEDSPPTFSRLHQFRLVYGGRPASPHDLYFSALNDINDYSLANGGFSIRVNDGDGDVVGLTGLSPTFKGDLYAFKFNNIYRIFGSPTGYGVAQITNEVGCVQHNTIIATQNDVFFVSPYAIHSLVNTDKYGSVESSTVSYPIFEYFQDNVNWNASKYMVATYDKPSNCYLLSFASAGSAINDRVLGFNIRTGEFFEWESVYYPTIGKYFDLNRQKSLVGEKDMGLGVLDQDISTDFGKAINVEVTTGIIFPLNNPKTRCDFTKAWILARPTNESTEFDVSYWVDGDLIETVKLDTSAPGAKFNDVQPAIIGQDYKIGSSLIGKDKTDLIVLEMELTGNGNSIQFDFKHEPPEDDPDQSFELYGIIFEFEYIEDKESNTAI